MRNFPWLTAIYHGTVQLLRYPMVLLGLLTAVELLPLLVGPYLLNVRSVNSWQDGFTFWFHPWAYSQIVILAFACIALPGRWHVRVSLALLATAWVWGAYMTGVHSCYWTTRWIGSWVNGLASELVWLFAITAFVVSLLVSLCGLELRWDPHFPRTGGPGQWQFSLGFLMTVVLVAGLILVVVRAALFTPSDWITFRGIMGITWPHFVQLAVWGLIGAVSMLAAVSSRRHWVWLFGLVAGGVTVSIFFGLIFNSPVVRGWWMPLAITIHPFFIANFLLKLGVQLPRVARLESLHRALASVR